MRDDGQPVSPPWRATGSPRDSASAAWRTSPASPPPSSPTGCATPALTPPEGAASDWAAWWEANAPAMSDDQRARVWQALDKVRFYEVVETELEA
jgi:hypothetical protein